MSATGTPAWLGIDLVAGALPWAQAVPATLSAFLERYPLRGALWLGLYADAGQRATLLLEWQAPWLDGERPSAATTDGAILAVRFDALERVELRLRGPQLSSLVSGPTNRAADAWRTHVVDGLGGDVTLIHAPGVRLLLLGRTREPLPILLPAETF